MTTVLHENKDSSMVGRIVMKDLFFAYFVLNADKLTDKQV